MASRRFLFQAAEGYADTTALTDETSLGKITLSGLGGIAVDAGSQRIVNVATPTTDSDGASKGYVDSVSQGLDVKASVRLTSTVNLAATRVGNVLTADANGAVGNMDGVALVVGNRVLLKDQTTGADNGIYTLTDAGSAGTPFIFTRATDADVSADVTAGMFAWVTEGTVNADSGWILTTDDPIVLNTTSLAFTQFSGAGQIVAGAGLLRTGNQLDVELATDPALEFDAGGVGGKLRFKPDTARGLNRDASGAFIALATDPGLQFTGGSLDAKLLSTGGLQKDSSGLSIKLDDTPDTLDTDADGLKVTGLPLSFKINGTAVSANFTAAAADSLVDAGDASTLHNHYIDRESWVASGAIAKADGIYISANNVVTKGDCTVDVKSRIIGVAEAAIADTATGKIVRQGVITGALSGATAGEKYFLGSTGQPVLIASVPSGGRTIQLGLAKNATDLLVRVVDYGKKATA
jgi:hypothetical protein